MINVSNYISKEKRLRSLDKQNLKSLWDVMKRGRLGSWSSSGRETYIW